MSSVCIKRYRAVNLGYSREVTPSFTHFLVYNQLYSVNWPCPNQYSKVILFFRILGRL